MLIPFIWLIWLPLFTIAQTESNFALMDVFGLQYVQQLKISPNGKTVVYRRMKMDIQKDRSMGNLWKIQSNGSGHQKLTSFDGNEFGAVWSPSGDRIAYARNSDQGSEIYVYWLQSGKTARLSQLEGSPSALSWSPNGHKLAFRMKVKSKVPNLIIMPPKPKWAQWAPPARITDRLYHEAE